MKQLLATLFSNKTNNPSEHRHATNHKENVELHCFCSCILQHVYLFIWKLLLKRRWSLRPARPALLEFIHIV